MINSDLPITDAEINVAEEVFLPDGATFDEEKRRIIRSTKTIDIMAVPGSGKTTVLLAKLYILAQRMPFNDRKGICVLTHSNVAIDEIKVRLGSKAEVLFSYPNFFGTIQSFVDKYLALPYYAIKRNSRSIIIDPKYYEERLEKQFKYGVKGFTTEEQKNARYYLKSNEVLFKNIRLRKVNGKNMITNGVYGKEIVVKRPQRSYKKQGDFSDSEKNKINNWIEALKLHLLKDGVLCYDDAYYLAEIYVNKYKNQLNKIFSKRFKYLFIDECQDIYPHQNDIIGNLFCDDVIIQKFGDPNQAIFDTGNSMDNMTWTPNVDSCMKITQSQRFGENIAKVLSKISANANHKIIGNSEIESKKPHIILFKKEDIGQVLEKFVGLIDKYGLQSSICSKKNRFKAVGWRGSDTGDVIEKPCLSSYYQNYCKSSKNTTTYEKKLFSYLKQKSKEEINTQGIKVYYDSIIAAILRFLYLVEVKNYNGSEYGRYFTKSTLMSYLNEHYKDEYLALKTSIAEWINIIHTGNEQYNNKVHKYIKNYFIKNFCLIWRKMDLSKATDFLDDKMIIEETSNSGNTNIYISSKYPDLEIKIDTVHAVKGETHTATLYLETFSRIHDIRKIVPFLKGEYVEKVALQKTAQEALKVAYVGMSRPTHLLCLAMNIDGVSQTDIGVLEEYGWEIVYIEKPSIV